MENAVLCFHFSVQLSCLVSAEKFQNTRSSSCLGIIDPEELGTIRNLMEGLLLAFAALLSKQGRCA